MNGCKTWHVPFFLYLSVSQYEEAAVYEKDSDACLEKIKPRTENIVSKPLQKVSRIFLA